MKANRAQLDKALKQPAGVRLFLFYGPDEAGSRELLARLVRTVGEGAERVSLSGSDLKGDPARLADEAASISLFGGARYIVVEPAGDESLAAAEALLQASAAANPVVLIAGALRATSKLLKLALAAPDAIAFASYVPEGRDASQLVIDMGRDLGLRIAPDCATRVAATSGGNRALIGNELAKFALFLGADAANPKMLEHEVLDSLGAASEEGDLSNLISAIAGGDPAAVQAELLRLESDGVEAIRLVRAMLGHMLMLTRLRAEVESGKRADDVVASSGRSIFWKDRDGVARQLNRWRPDALARSVERLLATERAAKASGAIGLAAVEEELLAIARQAARSR